MPNDRSPDKNPLIDRPWFNKLEDMISHYSAGGYEVMRYHNNARGHYVADMVMPKHKHWSGGDPDSIQEPVKLGSPAANADMVNHPPHYNNHPSGVECIQVTRWMNFNLGNAVKYLWRAGEKGSTIEDLEKSIWYIKDEIARLKSLDKSPLEEAVMNALTPEEVRALEGES